MALVSAEQCFAGSAANAAQNEQRLGPSMGLLASDASGMRRRHAGRVSSAPHAVDAASRFLDGAEAP